MPVVVTGASALIGRHAVAAFARASPEVRAYVRRREAAEPLRRLGVKVAVGDIEDVDTLEAVLADAHTVCHLVGGLIPPPPGDAAAYERAIAGSIRSVLAAALRSGVRRILYLSYPGAAAGSANPYLRAKGWAEEAIVGSGLDFVLIRTTHVYGPRSDWLVAAVEQARRFRAVVVGSGRQVLAPVFVEDVATVLAAADDRDRVVSGTWGLEGPTRITADEWTDVLAGRRRRKIHLKPGSAARLARLGGRSVPVAAMEVLAADSVADAPDAAREFGVAQTSLEEGLARSLEDLRAGGEGGPDRG